MDFFDEFTWNTVMNDTSLSNSIWESHIFRINRDVRFSKNKDPYKSHFSGFIVMGWKPNKNIRGRYHLKIEPGSSFFGWWAHMPEKAYLEKIRETIAEKWDELLEIIHHSEFKKYFWNLSQWDMLKTAPRWYSKDHKHINLLRRKSFTALCSISDKELLWEDIQDFLQKRVTALKPMIDWFNDIHI